MHSAVLFSMGVVGVLLIHLAMSLLNNPVTLVTKIEEAPANIASKGPFTSDYDSSIAVELQKQVRILCWVMTSPQTLYTKAAYVKDTWGRRCNKLLFMSSKAHETFPAIAIKVDEGRDHLTAKSMHAFKYVFDHHLEDADWFLKADDDTYVVLENLRYLLMDRSPQEPVYFGHHFGVIVQPQGYHSGGAGYVLSREALRRFGELGYHQEHICAEDGGAEDVEMGRCLQKLGVQAEQSHDVLGRSRFHCLSPESHIHGFYPEWYFKYDSHGGKHGVESISEFPVTFHYVSPHEMVNMEFSIYNMKAYGRSRPSVHPLLHNYYTSRRDNDTLASA